MTKEELRELQSTMRLIDCLSQRLEELRSRAAKVTSDLNAGPGGTGRQDRMASIISSIVEVEETISLKVEELSQKEKEILKAIEKLPHREQRLIILKYIQGLSWEEVAVSMGYSWRQIHNIHSDCLEKLGVKKKE